MKFVRLNYDDILEVKLLRNRQFQKAIEVAKDFCLLFEVKSIVIQYKDRLIQVDHRGDRIIPPPEGMS